MRYLILILFLASCTYTPPGAKHLTQSELAENSVGTEEVINNDLTSDDLGPDSVTSSEIATNAVDSDEINADAVGTSEIATNGVDSDEIAADAVGTSEIATNGVGNDELQDTIDIPTLSATTLNLSSGGAFKVKLDSGTIDYNDTPVTWSLGTIYSVSGVLNDGSDWYPFDYYHSPTTPGTFLYNESSSALKLTFNSGGTSITLDNTAPSTYPIQYRIMIFYQ